MKAITTPYGHRLVPDDAPERTLFDALMAKHIIRDALDGYATKGAALKAVDELVNKIQELTICPECGGDVSRRCLSCDKAGQ